MKTWEAGFGAPVKGMFFGSLNTSVVVSEGYDNKLKCINKMGSKKIAYLYQWHSPDCVIVDDVPDPSTKGDALVTMTPGLAIGVVTADCAPVLFAGATPVGKPVIGVAHAGVRGALKGVLANTVAQMRTLGAADIRASIGPTIHQKSYEVGPEFREEFIATDPVSIPFFKPKGDKFLFDLPGYVGALLDKERVAYTRIDVDTYEDEENCFSYRRSTHRGEPDYGRQLSAIMISEV